MKKKFRLLLFFGLLVVLIGADKLSKEIAGEHLKGQGTITYLHDTFRLQYVENVGAFLSFGSGLSPEASFWIFGIIPSLFLLGFLVYIIWNRNEMSLSIFISYVLILAGGIGNISDRLINDRHVTDFLNVGIGSLRTGIFNLADLFVTTGVICLFFFLRAESKNKPAQEA